MNKTYMFMLQFIFIGNLEYDANQSFVIIGEICFVKMPIGLL